MNSINRTHPLDILIPDNTLSLLEALVPFVDYSFKKPLVLFIKYREIMAIMQSLNNIDYISNCGFNCAPKSNEDFLTNILKYLPGDYAASLSQAKQMMSMFEMMNMMNHEKESSENYDDINKPNTYENGTYQDGAYQDGAYQDGTFQDGAYNYNNYHGDLFSNVMNILDNANNT